MKEQIRFFPLSSFNTYPFEIECAGISFCDGTYKISRNSSSIYVFEYVIKGTGNIICNNRSYTASQGDIYILPAGSSHTYFSDSNQPWTKIWFNIKGSLISSLLTTYSLSDYVVISVNDEKILGLFHEFINFTSQTLSTEEIFKLCSTKFFEIILAIYPYTCKSLTTRKKNAYLIQSILDTHIHSFIDLDELSTRLFYSKPYIISVFKEEFSITPYRYLMVKRIEAAKHLLTFSYLSIKDISNSLCFADAHYFSNQFKYYTGLSPTHYRQQTRE